MSGKQAAGVARRVERERIMAHLLLIDDDPDLLPEKVRHLFPAPAHRVEIAYTVARASSASRPRPLMSFSWTCACPTSPAWRS